MTSYLVTGASRGLGLGFVTELLKDPNSTVVAAARNPTESKGLQSLKSQYGDRLQFTVLDVTKQASIDSAVEETTKLLPNGLDNIISNAGIAGDPFAKWDDLTGEDLLEEVGFSVITHYNVARTFLPLIRKGKDRRILVLSSMLGSIELAQGMPIAIGYSAARAALNMIVRKWSPVLAKEGITIFAIHPGLVGTDMGGTIVDWVRNSGGTDIPQEQSSSDCVKVLKGATIEDAGKFFNHDGSKIPW